MRAHFEKIFRPVTGSFTCREFKPGTFCYPWHFHPEFELTLILEGAGRRFIGDHAATFDADDLVIIGPNLPHFWHSDPLAKQQKAHSIVIQFCGDFLGPTFFDLPEMQLIRKMLTASARGLEINGRTRKEVTSVMRELPRLKGSSRITSLLTILDIISRSQSLAPLSSHGFAPALNQFDEARIAKVFEFVDRNLCRPIDQPEAARLLHMTPASFSRFFKKKTGRSFTAFVNELRIGRACNLLLGGRHNVTEACYASGFQNLSNFNRRFRMTTGTAPREYSRQFEEQASPSGITTTATGKAPTSA